MPESSAITPGPEQLKALTHPVRVRMLALLRVDGPATATSLAARLGLNSGATSYHLRQLAQHGFITDDPERGTARERWWKAAHSSTVTRSAEPGADEDRETMDAYIQSVVSFYTHQAQRAVEDRPVLPEEWRRASTFSDWTLKLTPTRARAVVRAIGDALHAVDDEDDPTAEQFVVQLNAYPFLGHVGGDPA